MRDVSKYNVSWKSSKLDFIKMVSLFFFILPRSNLESVGDIKNIKLITFAFLLLLIHITTLHVAFLCLSLAGSNFYFLILWMKSQSMIIQMKATEPYFLLMLFDFMIIRIMTFRVCFTSFESEQSF